MGPLSELVRAAAAEIQKREHGVRDAGQQDDPSTDPSLLPSLSSIARTVVCEHLPLAEKEQLVKLLSAQIANEWEEEDDSDEDESDFDEEEPHVPGDKRMDQVLEAFIPQEVLEISDYRTMLTVRLMLHQVCGNIEKPKGVMADEGGWAKRERARWGSW